MAQVTVVIDPNTGEREYQVEGVQGGKCTDITDALVQANQHVDTQLTEEHAEVQELPDYISDMTGE
jgi:hypothetical protein